MSQSESIALFDKIKDNLSKISEKARSLYELRICELSFLADSALGFISDMRAVGLALYECLPLLSEELDGVHTEHSRGTESLAENSKRLEFSEKTAQSLDRVTLAALTVERSHETEYPITESEILSDLPPEPTFIYLKNAYSDEAYDVLTDNIPGARVVKYADGLKAAARAVFDGSASYCLLPLEEAGVRLASVSELISLYDLKINDVTAIFGFDGGADMKYAMLSRGYTVPPRDAADDRYLEVRHPMGAAVELSEIIYAASALGHRIYRLNTHRVAEGGIESYYYSLVLRDDERDFSSMLLYLSLFSTDTTVVGIYKNLE